MNQQSLKFIQALKDHADILSKYLEEHPEALARIVSELSTHQEPKKVTVTTELQRHFNTLFDESQGESLTSFGYAAAAIEFFNNHPEYRKQMGW